MIRARRSRRVLAAATAAAVVVGIAGAAGASAAPATQRAPHATARVSAVGHAVAGRVATFALTTSHAESYSLSFGDHTKTVTGKHGPATRVHHTFGKTGWYTVTLKVAAAHGKTATSKQRVLVLSPPIAASASPAAAAAAAPAAQSVVEPHTSGPTVTSYSPTSGPVRRTVVITGTGFTSPATVSFNGIPVAGTVDSPTQITAYVSHGSGATGSSGGSTGPLTVTTAGSTVTAPGTFTVTLGLALSAVVGPPTSTTTVYGSGFAASEAVDLYVGSTEVATANTDSHGTLTQAGVTIPAGTQPGSVEISAVGRHSALATEVAYTVQTDYAQLGFGTDARNVNPYENTVNAANVSGLGRAYSVPVGYSYGPPVEAGGLLFLANTDGVVRALNAATGAQVWSKTYSGVDFQGSPAVANGIVYVAATNDTVLALSTSSGSTVWSHHVGGAVDTSLTVANGIVYVGAEDDSLYALSATSGTQLWSYATSGAVESQPAVSDGVIYFGSDDEDLYALNATTGGYLWRFTSGGQVSATPAVYNGVVYVGSGDAKVYALSASSGHLIWSYATGAYIAAGAVVTPNTVIAASDDGKIYGLATATGALDWSFDTGGSIFRAPTEANGVIYSASSSGHVYALDVYGDPLFTFTDGGSDVAGPIVANGTVFEASNIGTLFALTLAGGTNQSN